MRAKVKTRRPISARSERTGQIATSVHHADNLDFIDRAIVGVWMGFVKNKIWTFDQYTRPGTDIVTARTEARIRGQ